jgi:hypothetical protein
MRRRNRVPWYHDFRARIRFERRARERYPDLNAPARSPGLRTDIVYRLTVDVPHYDPRCIEIRIRNGYSPGRPRITCDGPPESPHRYRGGYLCVWEPEDEPDGGWVHKDGLEELIERIRVHLFREAYWREYGEWLGTEVVHWGDKEVA